MKPYHDLTPKGKIFRMTLPRIIIYGILLLALYFACARLYQTIIKVKTPVERDKSLPVALSTKYYCAFDLMVKPRVLQTTPHLKSAFEWKTMEKAEEWKAWREKKFPEYTYKIEPNNEL